MRTVGSQEAVKELTQVDERWAVACDRAGHDVVLYREAVGWHKRRAVQWLRRFYVAPWLAVIVDVLPKLRHRGRRLDYVNADLRLAKLRAAEYAAAWRLGGDDAVLALRTQLVSSAADRHC